MTHYEKTLKAYAAGDKKGAYELFKSDPDGIDGITFAEFCTAFDKILIRRAERERAAKATELAWAAAG